MSKPAPKSASLALPETLLPDLRELISETKRGVAQTVNAGLVMLNWKIGQRIRREILNDKRAEYGAGIVKSLSAALQGEFGRGFSQRKLEDMVRFAAVFPDEEIAHALSAQLSWTHFRRLIAIDDPLKRDFYAEMCRVERWSTRTLAKKIDGLLFERTALSKKPEEQARQELAELREEDKLTPDLVFRDPYVLDFLGLEDTYSEADLEAAILREIEAFLLELGSGFCFVGRQYRMTVGRKDYHLDLLFFHRELSRLVAVDLKLGDFEPEHSAQMELYLRWLDKHERKPGEEAPVGLLLCSGKEHEEIELLELGQKGIRVAEYLTELPPPEILKEKLHQAIEIARSRVGESAKSPDK